MTWRDAVEGARERLLRSMELRLRADVPLELMACGCAVVSNYGPNTEWLLNEHNSLLASLEPASLAEALIAILQNDELRLRLTERALEFVHSTDWTKEIKSIESALTTNQAISDRTEIHVQ